MATKTIKAKPNSTVKWKVAREGYETQQGDYLMDKPTHTISVQLVQSKGTFRLVTVPDAATVSMTITSGEGTVTDKTVVATIGSIVEWTVSAEGYETQSGTKTITQTEESLMVELVAESKEKFKFTINSGDDSQFILPLSSDYSMFNSVSDYNMNVDWGDGQVETITGTTSETQNGVTHTYATANQDYEITLTPAGSEDGWMCCLGFGMEPMSPDMYPPGYEIPDPGCNALENRNKVRVLNSPYTTKMVVRTGHNDRVLNNAWRSCKKLTIGEQFKLPQDTTTVGDFFCSWMFMHCTGLTSLPSGFNIPQNVTTVGRNFCAGLFQDTGLTTLPEGFNFPQGITKMGDFFGSSIFEGCTSLTTLPSGFNLPQNITNYGEAFGQSMFNGCSSLTALPEGFSFPQGITTVSGYFCASMLKECSSLTTLPTSFKIPQGITTIDASFFAGTFSDCSKLKTGVINFFGTLELPSSEIEKRASFYHTFSNCTSLEEEISPTTIPQLKVSPSSTHGCFEGANPTAIANCPVNWGGLLAPKGTFTIQPSPSDSTVSMSVTSGKGTVDGNTATCDLNSVVHWEVSKSGFVTQTGDKTITKPSETMTVVLQAEVTAEPFTFKSDFKGEVIPGEKVWKLTTADQSQEITFYTKEMETSWLTNAVAGYYNPSLGETWVQLTQDKVMYGPYIPLYTDEECLNGAGIDLCMYAQDPNNTLYIYGNNCGEDWGFQLTEDRTDMSTYVPFIEGTYTSLVGQTVSIDWGDSQTSTITDGVFNKSTMGHTYAAEGLKTISITSTNNQMPPLKTTYDNRGIFKGGKTVDTPLLKMVDTTGTPTAEAAYTFYYSGFTSIPEKLFVNNPQIQRFVSTFSNSSLKAIPTDIFSYSSSITSFASVFSRTAITEIPVGLFTKGKDVTDISNIFGGCYNLATIPSGILDPMINVSDASQVFYNCTKLTSIPTGIFDKLTKLTTVERMCEYNKNMETIPNTLFKFNTLLTTVQQAFNGCHKLSSDVSQLFATTKKITNFTGAFQDCERLVLTADMFGTDINSRFVGVGKVNFTNMFNRAKDSSVVVATSTAPTLWATSYDETPTFEGCFLGAGNKDLTNYGMIPPEWGGPSPVGPTFLTFSSYQSVSGNPTVIYYTEPSLTEGTSDSKFYAVSSPEQTVLSEQENITSQVQLQPGPQGMMIVYNNDGFEMANPTVPAQKYCLWDFNPQMIPGAPEGMEPRQAFTLNPIPQDGDSVYIIPPGSYIAQEIGTIGVDWSVMEVGSGQYQLENNGIPFMRMEYGDVYIVSP